MNINTSIPRQQWAFRLLMVLAAVMSLGRAALPADGSFTLEDILGTPFPSQLTASPDGRTLAWVYDHQGVRNIWAARSPEFAARPVTPYPTDDGQVIGDLEFSPDGRTVVYVRGGGANRAGEFPNPLSSPGGAEQAVWAVDLSGGEPQRLGEGHSPLVSPAGDVVIWLHRGRILQAPLDGSAQPRPLFQARGGCRTLAWSPDGGRLLFVSDRDDRSFIGIYDVAADSIRWIKPDFNRDSHPVWSPDGTRIAFLRFAGERSDEVRTLSMDVGFAIVVADAASGQGRTIWQTDQGGGFAQYYNAHPLRWAAGDRLVFYSEHDGWMHLYSVSAEGGKATDLTPGEYEAEQSTLTTDNRSVIFNTNRDDVDRRHLWRVPVTGGPATRLTAGDGIEWSPVPLEDGQRIAIISSTAVRPAAVSIVPAGGGSPELMHPAVIPDSFPGGQLVTPRQIMFTAGDGLTIHGQLFLPRNPAGGQAPAVIFMHGGPIRQMLLGFHYSGYYHNAYAFNQFLASRGYVVLSVNFRCGIGYGRAFRNAANQGPRGAAEYQDIVAGARYLQTLDAVDPRRIGLWGGSYGGYLTAMGLARDSALFAAGVDLHGVHDWSLRARRWRGQDGWGLQGGEEMRLAFHSSPVADVAWWTSPVLVVHGDDDRNVDFIQSTDLVQRLRDLGRTPVETLVLPDEVHSFLLHRSWLTVFHAAADFFDRYMKDAPPATE
ncbi:MAG: S9 family peptidase [Acidobacteria bacterium]|nr:S9 family peptidase [Acidobacteriota bacterium]